MATYLLAPITVIRSLPRSALMFVSLLGIAPVAAAGSPEAEAAIAPAGPVPGVASPSTALDDAAPQAAATSREDEALRWQTKLETELVRLATRHADPSHAAADGTLAPELAEQLSALATRIAGRARVGIAVSDLSTGAVLFDHQADEAFNPASNQKLLTATAAVELLGADFRFETRALLDGDALVLVGGGDPSLQVEDLRSLAEEIAVVPQLQGVRRIVVDDSAFSDRRFGPGYDPDGPGYSYLAPSGALSLQFNTVEIRVHGNRRGELPTVTVDPPCEHLVIHNGATSSSRGSGLTVTTHDHGEHTVVAVSGKIRSGRTTRVRRRISDPGRFTATAFAQMLAEVTGDEPLPVQRGRVSETATPLAVHRSQPLPEVLGSALKYSNNFTTEQVLRTLGHLHSGQPGDWNNGRVVLERFWSAIGQDPDNLVIENGAGMSRRGRLSPRALVDLLSMVADDETEASKVVEVMPVAGVEGTLRGRLRRTDGRVRAKTGTLSGASALTGVISDHAGQPRLGFSVLVNGRVSSRSARRLQDRVVLALLHHLEE